MTCNGWKETTVGVFSPFTYGKGLPEKKRNASGEVKVYGSNGVVGVHDQALVGGPGIIIGRKGTVGTVTYSPTPFWPIDTTFYVTEEPDSRDLLYTYYLLKSLGLELMNADSAVPGLNRDAAHAKSIKVPPLPEQHAIARILSTLDDRIELNRKMNATLEAMAQAIFKSWFVDFDPVRAKMDGREPGGMDAETAALFPDAFEEVDGQEVPEGWEVKGLDEIATYLNGLALQKYPPEGEDYLPVIKIAQLRKGGVEGADKASANLDSAYIINDGDVIFSWSGSLAVVLWCGGRGALNQHLFKVTSDHYPKWFYYLWTIHYLPDFQAIAAGKATTMGHIQRRHLSEAKALVPPPKLLDGMNRTLAPLIEMIVANNVQSRTLAALRDTLLPKLISGEIRVPDAMLEVAEA
jgi:type I restriction enzyme S subunit